MKDTIEQRLETAQRRAVGQRNYRRARDRALARLASQYPDLYRELLEEERRKDEQEGKVWTDISGRNNRWVVSQSSDTSSGVSKGLGNSPDEGNLG